MSLRDLKRAGARPGRCSSLKNQRSRVSGLLALVVLHIVSGLLMGYFAGAVARLSITDRKALVFETGMQNAALAVAIIRSQFNADAGMLVVAGLWAIWHNISGLALAQVMRVRATRILKRV